MLTIAWIAWSSDDDEPAAHDAVAPDSGWYTGYIGRLDENGHEIGLIEQMPESSKIDEVLSWARERSPHVRIRPSWDPTRTYFYGDQQQNPGLPELVV